MKKCAKRGRPVYTMRFRVWIALLFAAAAMLTPAAAEDPVAVVPYRIDYGGALTVAVTIDGRGPYDFILDTGATLTLAFQNLAAIEQFQPAALGQRRVLGISGSAMLDTYRIGDISVGGAVLPDHVGVILQDWKAPRRSPAGIIGIDFLRQYAVVFNVREKTMTLYAHGKIPKDRIAGWRSVKLQAETYAAASGALYATRGKINRSPVNLIVDLGSVTTMINYRAVESMLPSVMTNDSAVGFTTGTRLKDVFDDRTRVRTALLDRVQIGRKAWRSVPVWVHDASIFDEIGVQGRAFGLLGADLLIAQDLALDFGEARLYIRQRP